MKKYILSLWITGLVSLACLAAPPNLIVPPKAEIGDVIQVKLDSSPVAVDWHITSSGKNVNVITLPDGTLIFGSGAAARNVQVQAAVAYKDEEKIKAVLLEAVVVVGNPPAPNPPAPTPVLPDGKFGLAKFVNGLVKDSDSAGRRALADSFISMQSAIIAGRFVKVEDILAATATANRDALGKAGVDKAGFEEFFTKLQEKLFALYQNNTLKTNDDVATAWGEIATGLTGGK